jgi:hypothetical protein
MVGGTGLGVAHEKYIIPQRGGYTQVKSGRAKNLPIPRCSFMGARRLPPPAL